MNKEQLLDYNRKITQSSPSGLVVITYELIEQNLQDAQMYFHKKDISQYRLSIKNARAFLSELISSLDLQYEISVQLLRIYLFINQALLCADFRNDISELPRICNMIRRLKDSFAEVAKSDHSGPVMENTQQVFVGMTYSKDSLNENVYVENMNRGYKV